MRAGAGARATVAVDLDIKISRMGSRVITTVSGDLDVHAAPALSSPLGDLIDDRGNLFVDVDLSRVGFLDAAALRVLVLHRMTLAAPRWRPGPGRRPPEPVPSPRGRWGSTRASSSAHFLREEILEIIGSPST